MFPAKTFEEISNEILRRYRDNDIVTIGILVADWEQSASREYIINYMNRFDEKSGEYIDFYLPGYVVSMMEESNDIRDRYHPNACVEWDDINGNRAFSLRRTHATYYFCRELYEDFLNVIENEMGIECTYNPMLILVEVNKQYDRGYLQYQKKMVIELDNDNVTGIRRAGMLFDRIFECARCCTTLNDYRNRLVRNYIKGEAIDTILGYVGEQISEVAVDKARGVFKYRIK